MAGDCFGGRAAGWILLDDLLADPGLLVGAVSVETCQQGVDLLQSRDMTGTKHDKDPAYRLAGQLLAAQLNLAAGAESCPAAGAAVRAAQLLLLSVGFGGEEVRPLAADELEAASVLAERLTDYNSGALCIP